MAMLELLSPAGSPEAVVAAVQNGADAIYMGFGGFNARRGAKNFTDEEFIDAVTYCRVRGCKVYVTLNTLVADREMNEAVRLAGIASDLGVDAILVQDLGLAQVLRRALPDVALHASTQMSIHNLAGVQAAAEMGITRAVLARELSLEQIRYIAAKSPIEVECFVHGALCVCHSGQCYMSSLIGRRSGNRGMCAQPCRLNYSMGGRMDDHPLSLKDNCLVEYLDALSSAGVACVKIEGRMKRPEYTAIVTGIYARAIRDGKNPTPAELQQMEDVFSRQGFTQGYLLDEKGVDMFGVREEQGERSLAKLFAEARRGYSGAELRRVPVKFFAVVTAGKPTKFGVEDMEGNRAAVNGPVPEKAISQSVSPEMLKEQFYKTGGTPYTCADMESIVEERLFLSSAALNDVRRRLLEELTEKRRLPPQRRTNSLPPMPANKAEFNLPSLNVQVLTAEQLTPELALMKPERVYVPIEILIDNFAALAPFAEAGSVPVAVLPRIVTDAEAAKVQDMLYRLKMMGVDEALVGNMGHVLMARLAKMEVRGDFGLNAFNSYGLEVLMAAGFVSATASFELRLSQIRDMAKPLSTEIIGYGRLPLMVTENCIIKNSLGKCSCHNSCQLTDRRGALFPVVREFGCRNVILNSSKLFIQDKMDELERLGIWAVRLMFTTESPKECVEVMRAFSGESDYRPNGLTRGLYYRGVD